MVRFDSMRAMMKSAVLVIIFTAALFLPMFTENAASEEVSEIEVIFTAVNPDNNNTYHLLSEASWSESAQVARGLDGYLVTINDEQENQWLMDTFGNYDGQSRHLWTGLLNPSDAANDLPRVDFRGAAFFKKKTTNMTKTV